MNLVLQSKSETNPRIVSEESLFLIFWFFPIFNVKQLSMKALVKVALVSLTLTACTAS